MPKRRCVICDTEFGSRRGACCSSLCASVYHDKFSEEVRLGKGPLFDSWNERRNEGMVRYGQKIQRRINKLKGTSNE